MAVSWDTIMINTSAPNTIGAGRDCNQRANCHFNTEKKVCRTGPPHARVVTPRPKYGTEVY